MLASSSLSVEIWQKILRYAISIPDFLDPDAFEGVLSNFALINPQCDRNNEPAYWRTERHRNALQRVCKSWDMYLRPFEHRYVRIVDIWHGKIPTSALTNAVRVYFDKCDCKCDFFGDPQLPFDPTRERHTVQYLHWIHWESVAPLDKLEIVDMRANQNTYDALVELAKCAKNVKTILAHTRNFGYSIQFVNWFPELRQFYGQGSHRNSNTVVGSNVETLSLSQPYQSRHFRSLPSWNLLRLRYLRIDYVYCTVFEVFQDDVYPILRAVGGNLHTLHLNSLPYGHIPAEIWEWCPRLEKVGTTLSLGVPPCISHPFHTFIATPESLSRIYPYFLDWPNVNTLVVDWIWNNTLTENHIPSLWRRKYADKVIRIEDQNGLTWKECVELSSRVSGRDFMRWFSWNSSRHNLPRRNL